MLATSTKSCPEVSLEAFEAVPAACILKERAGPGLLFNGHLSLGPSCFAKMRLQVNFQLAKGLAGRRALMPLA